MVRSKRWVAGGECKHRGKMANRGSFPGAACCLPTELLYYKAAPLQGNGGVSFYLRAFFAASITFCSSSAGSSW
jgi:hypothetical protein